MRPVDWIKELYLVGRIDLDTYKSQLFELKGSLLESIKEIDELMLTFIEKEWPADNSNSGVEKNI